MMANKFNNVFFPSDLNGTGQWRGVMPIQTCWCMGPGTGVNNTISNKVVVDQNYYKDISMFMVQRLVNDGQEKFFNELIVPYSKAFSFWTVYNIDDAMHYNDIPMYNRGRRAFLGEGTQENIRKMLNSADFVLTTTDYIKEYYHKTYGVPLDNIICIPNYLPRWWFGSFYDKEKSLENFRKFKNKPRVGMISSLSHYNVDGIMQDKDGKAVFKDKLPSGEEILKNEDGKLTEAKDCKPIQDDFDVIYDTVMATMDQVQWVFFGYAPPKLKEYIENGKVEYYPGISIMNYPQRLSSLRLNAIVAPIIDMEFNRCKSNIKWLEACALGVPLYAQNMVTYSKYMPESQLFKDSAELTEKIKKLKFMSTSVYEDIITRQWRWLNTSHNECGIPAKNWWLEDNMDPWMKLFTMRKKSQELSLNKYMEVKAQKEAAKKPDVPVLVDPDSGIEIIK